MTEPLALRSDAEALASPLPPLLAEAEHLADVVGEVEDHSISIKPLDSNGQDPNMAIQRVESKTEDFNMSTQRVERNGKDNNMASQRAVGETEDFHMPTQRVEGEGKDNNMASQRTTVSLQY